MSDAASAQALDPWSSRAVPLRLICRSHGIGQATGFFWRYKGRTYLVTNWHVLLGRNPTNMQPVHADGALPDEFEDPRLVAGGSPDKVIWSSIGLCDADGNAFWRQHPTHGAGIDIAVIEIPAGQNLPTPDGTRDTVVLPINGAFTSGSMLPEHNQGPALMPDWYRLAMGADLFILGFPLGLKPTGHLPIWKRASVATEISMGIDGKPAFLVDTATREGMSGAPVICIDRTAAATCGWITPGRNLFLVGVYSGRHIGAKKGEAQLGIVWHHSAISQIVSAGVPGAIDYSKMG